MNRTFGFSMQDVNIATTKTGSRPPSPQSGPDFSRERRLMAQGFRCIVGVDEVGRGPIAGPVTAAAVCLNPDAIPPGIQDSKRLSARQRAQLYQEICAVAKVSVAHASVEEIEDMNILRAAHLAMVRAIAGLGPSVDYALIDGNMLPRDLGRLPAQAVVKGDGLSASIAAASICAKVVRDALMVDLAQHFAGYGWEKNAGYPTKAHLKALLDLGVTPFHRRSFAPVHKILYQEK